MHPLCDVTHSQKHAIVLWEKYLAGECKAVSCNSGVHNNGPRLGAVGGSFYSLLLRTELGCRKNGQEKRKGGKITVDTMENRRLGGFVGWETMGDQMWLHKT